MLVFIVVPQKGLKLKSFLPFIQHICMLGFGLKIPLLLLLLLFLKISVKF